jgi:hypothetical protein
MPDRFARDQYSAPAARPACTSRLLSLGFLLAVPLLMNSIPFPITTTVHPAVAIDLALIHIPTECVVARFRQASAGEQAGIAGPNNGDFPGRKAFLSDRVVVALPIDKVPIYWSAL